MSLFVYNEHCKCVQEPHLKTYIHKAKTLRVMLLEVPNFTFTLVFCRHGDSRYQVN